MTTNSMSRWVRILIQFYCFKYFKHWFMLLRISAYLDDFDIKYHLVGLGSEEGPYIP